MAKSEKVIMRSMHATKSFPLEAVSSLVKKKMKKQNPTMIGAIKNTATSTYHQWIYSLIIP